MITCTNIYTFISSRSTMAMQDGFIQSANKTVRFVLNFVHRLICSILRFSLAKVYGKHGKSMPRIVDPLLLESATSIAGKIRTEQVTSTQVLKSFIRRIEQINPLLNCIVDERFKDALQEAADVDALIASNKYSVDELQKSKPFLGVPFSVKNIIGVKGMILSTGLWLRRNVLSAEDADAVKLMRKAGAIPFVITNTGELCVGWEAANRVHGRTLNPYDTNRCVGGSSGGEGCLQAAAGAPFGIGTDLAGSIRMPAIFNGIFGHKSSPYIISNHGQWPPATTPEEKYGLTIGPLCRFACDLQPILKVLAGDKAKVLNFDESVNLTDLKYFYQENDGDGLFVSPVDDDIRGGMNKVINYLRMEFNAQPEKLAFEEFRDSIFIVMASLKTANEAPSFDEKLANFNGRINPYVELLKWCVGASKSTVPGISMGIEGRIGIKYGSKTHQRKMQQRDDLRRKLEERLGDSGVFLYPTHPTVAPYHGEPLIRGFDMGYSGIFNMLGFPSTPVPLGLGKEGLPIGIQVVANRNQDRLCLAVACELERAFGGWIAPDNLTFKRKKCGPYDK